MESIIGSSSAFALA